jgi:hypothetical protein
VRLPEFIPSLEISSAKHCVSEEELKHSLSVMSASGVNPYFLLILLHLMPTDYLKNDKAKVEFYKFNPGHFSLTKKADHSQYPQFC